MSTEILGKAGIEDQPLNLTTSNPGRVHVCPG
jgi:hypothetical protein